jgi:hypothetical protein
MNILFTFSENAGVWLDVICDVRKYTWSIIDSNEKLKLLLEALLPFLIYRNQRKLVRMLIQLVIVTQF